MNQITAISAKPSSPLRVSPLRVSPGRTPIMTPGLPG
jgi:hypothetical protein